MKTFILISIVFLYAINDSDEISLIPQKHKRLKINVPYEDLKDHNACEEKQGFQSIFTIGTSMYFQGRYSNIIWKLNETAYTFNKLNFRDYKIPKNYLKMIPDFDLMDDLRPIFDLSKPIYAHIVYPMAFQCYNDTTSECYQININVLDEFVCMYGLMDSPKLAVGARGYHLQPLHYSKQRIKRFTYVNTLNYIRDACVLMKDPRFKEGSVFSTFSVNDDIRQYENDTVIITSRWFQASIQSKALTPETIEQKYLVLRKTDTDVYKDFVVNDNEIYHIFGYPFTFGNDFVIFTCPILCYSHSVLKIIETDFSIIEANITLNQLLRCYNKTYFEPNNFCKQNDFQSVFNLASDIYFQNMGKFWRYTNYSFNEFGNTNFQRHISGIRFDSDFVEFLEKDGWDTFREIKGFTYKAYNHDYCISSQAVVRERCESFYRTYPTYRVCLLGYNLKRDPVKNFTRRVDAYVYNPFGISKFTNLYNYNNTYTFCNRLINTAINLDTDGEPFVTSMINTFTNNWTNVYKPEANLIILYAQDFPFTSYVRSEYHIPIKPNMEIKDLNPTEFVTVTPDYEHFERDVFFFDRRNRFFALPTDISSMDWHIYIFEPRISKRLHWEAHALGDLFGCHKKLKTDNRKSAVIFSESIVLFEKEDPCHDFNSKSTVFNIGNYMYVKVYRHFYAYIRGRFYLDKYLSDLFNDYFDTRFRMTVYSYKSQGHLTSKRYYVIAMGRTKSSFGKYMFGQYMFATFFVTQPYFGVVEPLNDAHQMRYTRNTFGNKLLASASSQHLIPAAGFFYPFELPANVALNDKHPFVVFTGDYEYYTTYSWNCFEFGLIQDFSFKDGRRCHFRVSKVDADTAPWTKVIGLAHSNGSAYLFAWLRNNSVGMFRLSNNTKTNTTLRKLTELKSPNLLMPEYFICLSDVDPHDEEFSETEFEKIPVKWILWFIILILITLFVAIVVYIAIQNRKQSNEINKNVTQKPFDAQNNNKTDNNLSDSVTNNEEKQSQPKDETNEDKVEVNDEIQVKSDESSVRSSE